MCRSRRGRRASNGLAPELRREIGGVVRERYEDFGAPTPGAGEVEHGLSVETLRKWMMARGCWRSKKRLWGRGCTDGRRWASTVQIDGSPHACVRGSRADEHVDRVHRRRHQSADGAAFRRGRDHRSLHEDLARVSRPARPPVAIYSDKHSISGSIRGREGDLTQFTRRSDPGHPPIHGRHPPGQRPRERANQTDSRTAGGEGAAATRHRRHRKRQRLPARVAAASRWPQKPPRTPTASCSMTRPPSTSSSPSIPPESSAAISPADDRSREYQIPRSGQNGYRLRGSTVTICEKLRRPRSPSCARARPSTTASSLKASRRSPLDDEKSLCRTVDKARSLQRKRPSLQTLPRPPLEPLGSPPPSPFQGLPHRNPPPSSGHWQAVSERPQLTWYDGHLMTKAAARAEGQPTGVSSPLHPACHLPLSRGNTFRLHALSSLNPHLPLITPPAPLGRKSRFPAIAASAANAERSCHPHAHAKQRRPRSALTPCEQPPPSQSKGDILALLKGDI